MRSMSGAEWPSRRPSWIAQASVYQLGANTLIHPNAWNRSSKKFVKRMLLTNSVGGMRMAPLLVHTRDRGEGHLP
jgi:hypothetical protein